MGVKKHLRRALLATAVLLPFLSQVESTTVFSQCIDSCIGFSSCGITRPKCMCKAASGSFMDNVLVCMSFHCTNELSSAESLFILPMQAGCAGINRPIPEESIEQAEAVLNTLLGRLSKTTSTTVTDSPKSTPARQRTRTTESKTQPTRTNAPASSADSETTSSTDAPAPTTLTEVATQTGGQVSTSVNAAPNSDPTDSSPFANPGNGGGRIAGSYLWAGLPLVMAIALR